MAIEANTIDRRRLLLGSLAAVIVPAQAWAEQTAPGPLPAYVSAARRADGGFSIVLLDAHGQLLRELPLSDRGHDIAHHAASGRAIAFARRPGTFAVAFALDGRQPPVILSSQPGRHFFGHGAYSIDGRTLYATENDIANARGVVGIYDVAGGYRKTGEYPTYGVGPHELILLEDGRTLAIANGGLDTVPEASRENLNVADMQPSLTFVDARSGALLAKHALAAEMARLSLRHIAAGADGNVWFGGQWEGDAAATPQLIGRAGRDTALKLLAPEAASGALLKGYIGSVSASADGRIIAASAPKAGRIVFVDVMRGAVHGVSELKDVCGLAPAASGDAAVFVETSGFGVVREQAAGGKVLSQSELQGLAFDNHLRRVG